MSTPVRSPVESPGPDLESSVVFPRVRHASSSLPYRSSNPSLSTLFASTTLPTPRLSSGSATPTPSLTAGTSTATASQNGFGPSFGGRGAADPRELILHAFVPHVGILASEDTEEMMREKGLVDGFLELVRPFGEKVSGKVVIRDSIGSSRSWEEYGLRFTGLRDGLGAPKTPARRSAEVSDSRETVRPMMSYARVGGDESQVEDVVEKHLAFAESNTIDDDETLPGPLTDAISPFYALYLRRLLSAFPMTPHETFAHPVACVIAISSRNPNPIEELRTLYESTNQGDRKLPPWVNNEYLRYYVLVHDDDHDDIATSMSLYDQMKRKFGLHCHLLRLRSGRCVASDDDSLRLPASEWISASEELAEIQRRESTYEGEDPTPFIFESDATAVRTFVRELATQSIIPSMERLSALWNEQVVSRRRGLSGRFMSLSKRWTPFGSSRSSNPMAALGTSGSGSNYDSLQGFYQPESAEAIMRRLADFSFMLRDFKLAHSVYDLLRQDFSNDKAWKHLAGANEMAAISALMLASATPASGAVSGASTSSLSASSSSSKFRLDTIDNLLDTACYSYITRCSSPFYALRCLCLAIELLKLRVVVNTAAADAAVTWASKSLQMGLVGPLGRVLIEERVAACYAVRPGLGTLRLGSRMRSAAFWNVLAAEHWIRLGRYARAEHALAQAMKAYNAAQTEFPRTKEFVDQLRGTIAELRGVVPEGCEDDQDVEETEELLETKPHRRSMIAPPSPPAPIPTDGAVLEGGGKPEPPQDGFGVQEMANPGMED